MRNRILLVEDDDRLASLVKEFLEQHDFIVAIECRGDRAVTRILDEDFDCLILDVLLPGIDGFEICQRISVPAQRVEAIDTVGAGDTFVGVLACQIARKQTVAQAARLANAAAALSVSKQGAQPSIPNRQQKKEIKN